MCVCEEGRCVCVKREDVCVCEEGRCVCVSGKDMCEEGRCVIPSKVPPTLHDAHLQSWVLHCSSKYPAPVTPSQPPTTALRLTSSHPLSSLLPTLSCSSSCLPTAEPPSDNLPTPPSLPLTVSVLPASLVTFTLSLPPSSSLPTLTGWEWS